MPEHGGSVLRLFRDPQRHVALGQTRQSLFDVRRRLIVADDGLEPVDRAYVVVLVQVVAADLHLGSREIVLARCG